MFGGRGARMGHRALLPSGDQSHANRCEPIGCESTLKCHGPALSSPTSSDGRVFSAPIPEGRLSTFRHINHSLIQARVLDCTALILQRVASCPVELRVNNLFCIATQRQVRVVGHHDDLPTLLGFLDDWHQH